MTLELRVVSGARQGLVMRTDRPTLLVGRHAACDLRLDPTEDLDVSSRHAELRSEAGRWFVRDAGSTNGTFVNDQRLAAERELRTGDVIGLGAAGPRVAVRVVRAGASGRTRALLAVAALLVIAIGLPAVLVARSRARTAAAAPAARDSSRTQLAGAPSAVAGATGAGADFRTAAAASGPAVAFLVSTLGGRTFGGTAFGVTPEGLLVTNRHLVENGTTRAERLIVKFSDTPTWLPARVVRTATDRDDDLALLQIEVPGQYPVVAGIRAQPELPVGAPVTSIGFPLPDESPTDSVNAQEMARSSLVAGVVSKRLARLLQIDSYATHGASGSPVLDRQGFVVGVVYGGPRESNGRLVYATPSDRLLAFLGSDASLGLVR